MLPSSQYVISLFIHITFGTRDGELSAGQSFILNSKLVIIRLKIKVLCEVNGVVANTPTLCSSSHNRGPAAVAPPRRVGTT